MRSALDAITAPDAVDWYMMAGDRLRSSQRPLSHTERRVPHRTEAHMFQSGLLKAKKILVTGGGTGSG